MAFLTLGLALAPYALPLLPQDRTIAYMKAIGIETPNAEGKEEGALPQHYADMHGWENMARVVSEVYLSLPVEERNRALVYGRNYGEAAAVDYYRGKYDLPPSISPHNNYWIWGFPDGTSTLIIIGGSLEDHRAHFEEVEQAALIRNRYAMPYETDLPVFIARKPKIALADVWDRLKNFN